MKKTSRRDGYRTQPRGSPSIDDIPRGRYVSVIRQGFKDLGIDRLPPCEPATLKGFLQSLNMMLDLSERLNQIAKREERERPQSYPDVWGKFMARLDVLVAREYAKRHVHGNADSVGDGVTGN